MYERQQSKPSSSLPRSSTPLLTPPPPTPTAEQFKSASTKVLEDKRLVAEGARNAYEKVKANPSAIATALRSHEARAKRAEREYEEVEAAWERK